MDEAERKEQVELAVGGDADALQRLLVEYHAALCGVVGPAIEPAARRYVEPDDVLQDAYVGAFRAISRCSFDGPGAFYGWLKQIAVHELKNRQRALRAQKRDVGRVVHGSMGSRATQTELVYRLAGTESTPSRKVARHEATAAVLTSLARLPDGQRHVIRLRFLEGMSVADVASVLGTTEEAVHGSCRRGLLALRGLLTSISRYLTR